MGFNNPALSWSELERRLADRPAAARTGAEPTAGAAHEPSPTRPRRPPASAKPPAERPPAERPSAELPYAELPYAELHCHSNFSFLDGASDPERLAQEAAALGIETLALTDHNGLYGVVRFARAARAVGLRTVFGAELTVGGAVPRAASGAEPDPHGQHLIVLARDPEGYASLSSLISHAQLNGEKNLPRLTFADLAEAASRGAGNHWAVLTGCRKGIVPAALEAEGPKAATRELRQMMAAFGSHNVFVELWDHGSPLDSVRNDALVRIADAADAQVIASNNVHLATPADRELAAAMAAIRSRRSLDEIDPWLPGASGAHLRSPAEQYRRFARYPGVIEAAAQLGRACAFDLQLVAPNLPPYPCPAHPEGRPMTEMEYLVELTERGAEQRYGGRRSERIAGAWAQIDRELALIKQLGFAGYFLIVADIVAFCRDHDIYCQGRGSAANSAVCFALGITKADAVALGLLFERFLSPERDGPPDIDLDIESDRREEVIQYVYNRHGRTHAAQVANVITYRSRSAVRDAAKALGYSVGQQDAWSKGLSYWEPLPRAGGPADTDAAGNSPEPDAAEPDRPDDGAANVIPPTVLSLAHQLAGAPRHLGIHSGGMVMCDRPVIEVCPVERARMENRTVLQWDKEDCAAAGLVKFDLLGLGMLSALHYSVDHIKDAYGIDIDLAEITQDDAVYDMLCVGDSIGVFQVESRAQIATLPRLKPRCFYDLVVEVALIRPGPIQGGSVHPYIRRRNGTEPVTFLHPLLRNALEKTLGIPLFQEQLMQIAMDVAGFSPAEADQLRQAIGSKRSTERVRALAHRFAEGAMARGVTEETAGQIWLKLAAFASYGFPESHSISFAYIVYSSAWLKYHYPAAFCAGLLDAQPMGFYSPHSLAQDARRHGVEVRTPDINASDWNSSLEWTGGSERSAHAWRPTARWIRNPDIPQPAVRLGLESVRSIGTEVAKAIAAGRPWADAEDLRRRGGLDQRQIESLATAGALASFAGADGRPLDRRQALWSAGAAAATSADQLAGVVTGTEAPRLPGMEDWEIAQADLWASGVSPDGHPTKFIRSRLAALGVVCASRLYELPDRTKVLVGGVVTHRQRPSTAGGITFMNLEDETGLINIVVSVGCWRRYRRIATSASMLLIRGTLERTVDDVVNVVAERLDPVERVLTVDADFVLRSRDFR